LNRRQRKTALRLTAILQIADSLDRSYQQLVQDVRCEFKGKRVVISVYGEEDCQLELWTADRKAKWFREVGPLPVQGYIPRKPSGSRTPLPRMNNLTDRAHLAAQAWSRSNRPGTST